MTETVKYDLEAITKKHYSFPYLCYSIIKTEDLDTFFILEWQAKREF